MHMVSITRPAPCRLPPAPPPALAATALSLGQLALIAAVLGWLVRWLLPHLPH